MRSAVLLTLKSEVGKVRNLIGADPRSHHPHLPYWEWGGGGEGEQANIADQDLTARWSHRVGDTTWWTVAYTSVDHERLVRSAVHHGYGVMDVGGGWATYPGLTR